MVITMTKNLRAPGFMLVALAIAVLIVFAGAEAHAEAEELRDGVRVEISGGIPAGALRDGTRDTFSQLAGGAEIVIESDTPIAAIYLVWDKLPGVWTLSAGGAPEERDTGFLHEAVLPDTPVTSATIKIGANGAALCDIYVFSEGELPSWVQVWEPILERADLLALPTHADDEHLFFGGILPTYAGERGLRVQVVYMTNHWDDRVRPHEQLDGLWTVGVTSYPLVAEFPDLYASKESLAAAEQVYGRETILEFQVELLRRFKPQVVVGHDLNGEYGHGAHILNAQTLREALELAADESKFPDSAQRYGVWDTPKCYLHLYEENKLVIEWDVPLAAFDGRTGFEMAVEGFSKHVSQQQYFAVQRGGTWQDCRIFGLLRSLVGADTAGNIDLFEHVEIPPDPTPEPELTQTPEPPPAPSETYIAGFATAPPERELLTAPAPVVGSGSEGEAQSKLFVLITLVVLLVAVVIIAISRRGRR